MAKSAYVGVDGIARKVKKMYVGVDSKARKVKKGYIGVGGVARIWFSSDLVNYLGSVSRLDNTATGSPSAASTGDYALFAGLDPKYKTAVEALSKSFVHSTAPDLKKARNMIGSGSIGDYAVFAGGWNSSSNYASEYDRTEVDAYSSTLVKKTAGSLSTKRAYASSANVGNYLLFGNGNCDNEDVLVDTYSSSLVHGTASALTCSESYKTNARGASTTSYALFGGGGRGSIYTNLVDAYSSSLVKSSAPSLSVAREPYGASVGEFGLFIGGKSSNGDENVVDAYSNDLVTFTATPLSVNNPLIRNPARAGKYLIIPLYDTVSPYNCMAVDVYSDSLVKISAPILPNRLGCRGVTLGNLALFFGGYSGDTTNGSTANQEIYAYSTEST